MKKVMISKLKRKVGSSKKIIIYGAGNFAKVYYKVLIQNGIEIEYCIVTEKKDSNTHLGEVSIYSINEKLEDIKKNNKIIVVLVSKPLVTGIRDMLDKYGLKEYIIMLDFIRTEIFDKQNRNKNIENWIESIAEWHLDNQNTKIVDLQVVKKNIINIINGEKIDKRVVFLVGHMSPRVIKIYKALCDNGYDILVLFYSRIISDDPIYEEFKEKNDYCVCEYLEEILYYIILSHAKIVHIFTNYNNGSTAIAYMLIRAKSILPTIVYETYDIANGMYWTVGEKILEDERYCLENCDGICCRGNEIEYLINELHFNIKDNVIKFFDYLGDELFYSENSDELSLCYAGHFVTEEEYPDFVYACMLDFAKLCEENHCHFHLYPSVWNEERYKNYVELCQKSKYFHFHKPIPYKNLLKELSNFDFEVIPSKGGYLNRERNGTYLKPKIIYSATNKFFDSLQAGLPIISPYPVKFSNYFEKAGVLLSWTIGEFNFEELRQKKVELKKNVEKFREKLQIRYRIHELIDFYNSL